MEIRAFPGDPFAAVDSVSNSDGTLTISPTTGNVVASLNLAHANSWTASQTGLFTGLGTSTVDAFIASNTTAAALGAQQVSPSLHLQGQGWGTTAGTSQSVDYRINLLPVQSTVPTGNLLFQSSINGGAYSNQMTLDTAGNIMLQGNLQVSNGNSAGVGIGIIGTSNLVTFASNVGSSSNLALYTLNATNVNYRNALGGNTSSVAVTTNNVYANTIIAASPLTTAASGTHSFLINLGVKALGTVTSGGASITNTATFYIDGASSAGTNNYALFINAGKTQLAPSTTSAASLTIPSGTAPSNPVNGDYWYDSTQKGNISFVNGVKQVHEGIIFTQTQVVTVANTLTETSLDGTGVGTKTLPANFFVAGKTVKIKGMGYHSAVSNPNITIKVKFGSTVILTTGAVASANSTNAFVEVDALITCATTGITGTVNAQGVYKEGGAGANLFGMVNTSPVTVDTTASQAITVTAQWGTASASNTITLSNLEIEVLN